MTLVQAPGERGGQNVRLEQVRSIIFNKQQENSTLVVEESN
jgi:hypothetical protein